MASELGEIERLDAVARIVDSLRATYPDAKKFKAEICFEFQQDAGSEADAEISQLCPIVNIEIER